MALCLKYFYCFSVFLSVFLPGIVSDEIDAVYKFLSWKLDDVLTETKHLKIKVDNIDARVKNVEEKLQGLQTTTPNPIDLRIEEQRRELETELKDSLEMQELSVQKMLSKEKMLLRESMKNFTIVFTELKSEIQTQMSVFNASFKEEVNSIGTEFDNLKSEIRLEMMEYNKTLSEDISAIKETFEINLKDMYEIGNNKSMVLMKDIAELTSDWNSTTHNISQILQTMEKTMVSNIEEIENRMITDVEKKQRETRQNISRVQADVHSLSTNISTFTSVLSNRISSESSSLSSNISLLSSSLSSQMSSHSNRIYLLEERMDGIDECNSNPCMNNATCVDGINSYSCRCLSGYIGTNCQNIDECSSAPCKNGATCEDKVNGYTCSCTINWSGTQCDQTSHYGTDFYIGIYPHIKYDELNRDIYIDIASQQDGTAVLSDPYLNIHHNVTIKVGATTLNVNKTIMTTETFIETRGIRIQTDVPVALFVTMFLPLYTDTYLALPVTALGTSYKVASYDPVNDYYPAFYSIFGMKENTSVTTNFKNQTTSFTLQPLSVRQHDSQQDLTGTYIVANQDFAVISGTACACIPRNISYCDYIVEQMVPTTHYHKNFIVPPVFPKQGFVLKILTIQNETVCIKNTTNTICNISSILPDGEMLMGTDPVVVTSAAPISVVQYGVGYFFDLVNSGPFMTVIPGIGNYLNEYYFVVPLVYIDLNSYLSVIVPSSLANELYLDGSSLTVIKQYNVPDPFSNYTVIIANITAGYHRLWHANSNVMFGATVYGLSYYYGYGFPVGFGFTNG